MDRSLSRFGRSAATGLCFAGFWLLAAAALPTALAAILLATRDPQLRARRTRRLAAAGFRLLLRTTAALGLAEFSSEGDEWAAAARGRLVVANHPCFLDALVLLARMPEANCIVKGRLRRHPLFAPYVRAAGYLGNGAGPEAVVAQCRAACERGEPVLVFPEGTRTRAGAPPQLGRGAAQIALRAGLEILPVVISCDPQVLTHGAPWHRMPGGRVRHVIRFRRPRTAESFGPVAGLEPPRAARRVTRGLQEYFIRELSVPDDVQARQPTLAASLQRSLP